jgi:RHS repeat-associated protein
MYKVHAFRLGVRARPGGYPTSGANKSETGGKVSELQAGHSSEIRGRWASTVSVRSEANPPSAFRAVLLALTAVVALLVPVTTSSATVLPATITANTTLTAAGSPYTGGSIKLEPGVTLQAEAGAQVVVNSLEVLGTLKAEGTAESPVTFRSSSELSTWNGIVFKAGSGASVLDHAEIKRAGSTSISYAIKIENSSPHITNSKILATTGWPLYTTGESAPEIHDNFISGGRAVYFETGGKTLGLNFHDNWVEKQWGSGAVFVEPSAGPVVATSLGDNVITNNSATVAIEYNGAPNNSEIPPDIGSNTVFGNTWLPSGNDVSFAGVLNKSATWEAPMTARLRLNGSLKVPNGVNLTMKPGVTLLGGSLEVLGTLKAEGTAEAPVTFKPASEAGTWNGIAFKAGSGASVLDHVEVKRAGTSSTSYAIKIEHSSPRITNSTIRETTGWPLYTTGESAPEIHDNFISGGRAVYFETGGKTLGLNFHDNWVEKQWGSAAVFVEPSAGPVVATSLGDNVVTNNNATQGIYYNGGPNNSEIPPDIANNLVFANTGGASTNQIAFAGILNKSMTWEPGLRVLRLEGTLTVAGGKTLTLKPGVNLLAGSMKVQGTLRAEGTAASPVTFEPKNSASSCGYIRFESGSGGSVLDHLEIAQCSAGTGLGAVEIKGVSPTVTNSTFRSNGPYAIRVTESGAPKIERNRFRANTAGLSYSGTGKLAAPNNDWGCTSGPQPAGCGDSVTANVDWKPAAPTPEKNGSCQGEESQCPKGADPVSLATGQLSYSHRDLLLTNKSRMPLEFTRSYSSGSSADAGLGPGWSQSGLASATELASGDVLVVRQDGRQDVFSKAESGYTAPSGVTSTLSKVEGTFQLTALERSVYRFDSSGRVASVTDDHGLKTTYGYNAEGRLATITDPSAQTLTFSYNASNHITLVKDSTGREVKYTYSAAGDLATVTDALGGVTEYTYDSAHQLKTIKDPRGNVILKNTYDGQGRIIEQRDGLENLWELEYKAGETVVTEPRGGQLKYGFDSQNRIVSEADQLGNATTTSYDAAGNVDQVIEPGGAKWTFGHDAAGNLTSATDPEGGERSYEYDSQNRLTHLTDARGNSWSYEWSVADDLTKVTDPEGGETAFTYNGAGQPLTRTDPDKHKSEFSWDTRGNQLSATDPLGHKTSFGYDSRNYLTSKALPGLKAEALERNALGDLLARTTPEGHKTKYTYDANGLPTQVTDPAEGVWKIERNAMERPIVYVDPLGQEAKVTYDGNLKPVKLVDRRGSETTYGYDPANQLTEVDRPEGEMWQFGYDSRGNRSIMIDPRGNETTYGYDLLDRMTEADEPLSVTTEYGYDASSNLTSVTDPRGNATSYAYDKHDRLTEIAQPLEKETTYTYDPAGNKLSRTTALGTLDYSYDAADRLTEVSSGESTLRSYGYDAAGRRTSAIDAEGHEIEIGYTEEGRPSAIDDGRGQSLTRSYDSRGNLLKQVDGRGTLEHGYDKLSRMTSLTDPQGKSLGFGYDPESDLVEVTRPNGVTTVNLYNDADRLAETTSKMAESLSVLESLKYAYDAAGNVTSKTDQRLEQETSYAYDALNRLAEFDPPGEGSTTYGYDAAGNRTQAGGTTYSFNALNQPTESSAGTTFGYDGASRLTSKIAGSEETTYAWDLFNHLAKVEGPSGTATYAFDGVERLSERNDGETSEILHYGDLGDLPSFKTAGEGEATISYVQGPRGLTEQRSGEATSFPLVDGHGDVTAIVDTSAEVKSRQSFDPWGNQISGPGLEMGYLGAWERPSDPSSGVIQMGARSYVPSLGAFASEDPVLGHLGIGVSANRYPYAWNDPLNRFDLNGQDPLLGMPICVFACSPPAQEYAHDRAGDFVKLLKNALLEIHWDGPECEKKIIASSNPFFPCEEVEGELEYKNSEPGVVVPPYTPMGPHPAPGSFFPRVFLGPTLEPVPVYPIVP